MSFTAVQISFLQRLAQDTPPARPAGAAAKYFCSEFSIGVLVRNQVEYRAEHFEAAKNLLQLHDLPVLALGPGASRAEAAAFGGMSEKSLSAAPHADSVAVKFLGRCTLDERELFAPRGGYMVLTAEQAMRVSCECILLVENLETFRYLESYSWIDPVGLNVLVLYRGDKELPGKTAGEVVRARVEPIWGFFDFDPAGLALANAQPPGRLERLVLPSATWLRRASNTQRGRQLFDAQVLAYGAVLEKSEHPAVTGPWQLMKELGSAVTQERMLSADRG